MSANAIHAGVLLRTLRQRRALTLETFARQIKLFDPGWLSRIETGQRPLTANILKDIEVYAGFSKQEMRLLWQQAMKDHLWRNFGRHGSEYLSEWLA